MTSDLASLMKQADHVLFDFDGPICSVFAGYPAPKIAAELRQLLTGQGVAVPDVIVEDEGPHDVLAYAGSLGRPFLTRDVEDALTSAELVAVRSASLTPGALEAVRSCERSGRSLAYVSNNAASAIRRYLYDHRLGGLVIGRPYARPGLMKPNPYSINRALERLGATANRTVLIGDAITDVEAARAAGILSIGYANKPGKATGLTAAGADVVIGDMAELADVLR